MSKLHALDPIATDDDGRPYRHVLETEAVSQCAERCVECRGFAAVPHPRAKIRPELYAGVEVIERCRGIALCQSRNCQVMHLIRHDEALLEQQRREATEATEAARQRGRSAA